MTVKGIRLTDAQAEIYGIFKQYKKLPDHALVPLAQHVTSVHQSSSGIRSRRAELVEKGLLREVARTRTASGRSAAIYGLVR